MSSILGGAANPLLGIISYGAGAAMGPALRPPIQDLINEAWTLHPVRPFSAETAAAMVVEGVWTQERAHSEGAKVGIDAQRIDDLIQLFDDPPPLAELFALWRRGLISEGKFREAVAHHRIETDYTDALVATKDILLPPDVLANARQQGFVDEARQKREAALQGVDAERAEVQFLLSGNPPGPETLLDWLRRGVVTEAEFKQGLREGRIKTKYTDEYLAVRNRLLTVHEIVNLRLRGWIDDGAMNRRAAQLGYDADATHDLFLGQGRPISFRQVFIGERRGGVYDGPVGELNPPFLKSLQESNIRPEWYNLAWAQRHSLPSAFVLRNLTQAGDITVADAHRLLLWAGWPEDLAAKVSAAWGSGGNAAARDETVSQLRAEYEGGFIPETDLQAQLVKLGYDAETATMLTHLGDAARVKSQRDAAITYLRGLYVKHRIDDARATTDLAALGVVQTALDQIMFVWKLEREATTTTLTRAEVKAAFKRGIMDRPTALATLEALGMSEADAGTYLDS